MAELLNTIVPIFVVIGVGLLAFALYSFAEARWRRIDLSEVMD